MRWVCGGFRLPRGWLLDLFRQLLGTLGKKISQLENIIALCGWDEENFLRHAPHICQFWYTTALFGPVKTTQKSGNSWQKSTQFRVLLIKSILAWKKYITAGAGGGDLYELWNVSVFDFCVCLGIPRFDHDIRKTMSQFWHVIQC